MAMESKGEGGKDVCGRAEGCDRGEQEGEGDKARRRRRRAMEEMGRIEGGQREGGKEGRGGARCRCRWSSRLPAVSMHDGVAEPQPHSASATTGLPCKSMHALRPGSGPALARPTCPQI
eukprot:363552-Chlamydomonas_euryale.AAC.4